MLNARGYVFAGLSEIRDFRLHIAEAGKGAMRDNCFHGLFA
jgi:hypothetical protein